MNLRLLAYLLAAAIVGATFGTTAADAKGLPPKQKFEVTYEAEFGQEWYAFGDDNENWDFAVQCIVGLRGAGTSEFHARRTRKVVSMPANAKTGVIYGQVPVEAWLYRTLTMGERPAEGCGYNDYDQLAAKKDCDAETPQWGLHGNPPAYLNIIAGKGVVSTEVQRLKEKEHIDYIWDFCPSYGHEEGDVGGVAKLPAKKLFDGRAHTIKGKSRHDQLGPETSQAEGFSEYRLTIRYLGKKKG